MGLPSRCSELQYSGQEVTKQCEDHHYLSSLYGHLGVSHVIIALWVYGMTEQYTEVSTQSPGVADGLEDG